MHLLLFMYFNTTKLKIGFYQRRGEDLVPSRHVSRVISSTPIEYYVCMCVLANNFYFDSCFV
jgi:hypothetical protein